MGKKVKEYKSGDFIFAKVKGYPAWPARVQRANGKKYFVYFYGTGETANLPPNMIFDYAENKDKFLNKAVKRRDFNDGVQQIEHDFANNVPLDEVIGGAVPEALEDATANDTINDSAINDTMDTTADATSAEDTVADTTANTTQNDTAVDDSDDAGALVIDEGKQQKSKKSKTESTKTPAKETHAKETTAKETPAKETTAKENPAKDTPAKAPKTPRGKARKEESKADELDEEKRDEEIVSRSGRKIRPKRYIDEQTDDNATLPSPAAKKKRGASPSIDKETKDKAVDKNIKHFNAVSQSELEDLKAPFKPADADKDNILIAYLPAGQYVGVKLFQSKPTSFKNDSSRLQWDKQAAANGVTLKMQLEKGHVTPQSVLAQLVMDLNLTDEEKATLDKERETEEKKSRVQFLKTEMKLIELDAKIKTCLCLEKADTELCLKLLDELMELEVKPLMLLKHPTCLETVKRMRAYVGNTPSWDLSESAALVFSKQAHRIRKQADTLYKSMKDLFTTPEGLSFWEFFSERVLQFKKATGSLNADELLEMVHEPLEMTMTTSHTTKAAVQEANAVEPQLEEDEVTHKKKSNSAKSKKPPPANSTPQKPQLKRQSSRKQQQDDKEKDKDKETSKKPEENNTANEETSKTDGPEEGISKELDTVPNKEKDSTKEADSNKETENEKESDKEEAPKENSTVEPPKENSTVEPEKENAKAEPEPKTPEKKPESDKSEVNAKETVENEKSEKEDDKSTKEVEKEKEKEKEKQDVEEPRAKRSRGETKKTEPPPPRSPGKRKSKKASA